MNGAVSNGVVVVVAAGNDAKDACNYSPASAADAITVGSTTDKDEKSPFSNIGNCVDVYAPGSDIISASSSSNTGSKTLSGTSMASPRKFESLAKSISYLFVSSKDVHSIFRFHC